jgi:hypothetical protein
MPAPIASPTAIHVLVLVVLPSVISSSFPYSTGQLYHHLRSLTHCGIVEQDGRGSYRVAPRAVVPALVLLTAAADVAGQLRGGP